MNNWKSRYDEYFVQIEGAEGPRVVPRQCGDMDVETFIEEELRMQAEEIIETASIYYPMTDTGRELGKRLRTKYLKEAQRADYEQNEQEVER